MLLTSPFPTHTHARPHARMHAQWQQQQNINNSCILSLECNGGSIVAHFNIVTGLLFQFWMCISTVHHIIYTKNEKTIEPAYENLPLIE